LEKEGLLVPLFDRDQRKLPQRQRELAYWVAEQVLMEQTDKGLLLVERHAGIIGRDLWEALCWKLRVDESIDWTRAIVRRWVLLLIETCPSESLSRLSTLLPKAAHAAPDALGLVMLRSLVSPRIVLAKRMDFFTIAETAEGIQYEDEAVFELATYSKSKWQRL
jgi:hypothetical protein